MCSANRVRSAASPCALNASRQRASGTSIGEMHALRGHDAAHTQIQLQIARQALYLRRHLIEQYTADHAGTDQPDRNRVRRQIEAGMHRPQRTRRVLAVDDDGDIALRGALRDRAHADSGVTERAEYLRGHAMRARHAVADDGENAAAGVDFDALDLTLAQFTVEGLTHDGFGAALPPREWRSRSNARSCPAKSGSPKCHDRAARRTNDARYRARRSCPRLRDSRARYDRCR